MFNKLKEKHKSCKESGIAWKLFEKLINNPYINLGLFLCNQYREYKDNWIYWDLDDNDSTTGFCMFPSKEEAYRALINWKRITNLQTPHLHKVQYNRGIGIHLENRFIGGNGDYPILIAKEFKIL